MPHSPLRPRRGLGESCAATPKFPLAQTAALCVVSFGFGNTWPLAQALSAEVVGWLVGWLVGW